MAVLLGASAQGANPREPVKSGLVKAGLVEERGQVGGFGIPGSPNPPASEAPRPVLAALVPGQTMRAVPLSNSGTASA